MTSLRSHPTPFRYDSHGNPVGLDWEVLSAGQTPDPSVWSQASLVKDKRAANRISDETEMLIVRLHGEGKSAVEIAEYTAVVPKTVAAVLDRHEITQNRGRGQRNRTPDHTANEVVRLYTEEKLGGAGIRSRTGLSHQTIYKILNRRGIPTRNQKRASA